MTLFYQLNIYLSIYLSNKNVSFTVKCQPKIVYKNSTVWNTTHVTCQNYPPGGVLHPSDDVRRVHSLSSIMTPGEMYWIDGEVYNLGCKNGKTAVNRLNAKKKGKYLTQSYYKTLIPIEK